MISKAQLKAQEKYRKNNTRNVTLQLNKNTDKDILKKLDEVPSKMGYIKELIRKDLEKK